LDLARNLHARSLVVLSEEACLVYVLAESGVRGHLRSGRIERQSSGKLTVFDVHGDWFEYLSGDRIRSWCVVGLDGKPVDGWREILPKDLPQLLPAP
jgi:hypothetical protein